MSASYDRNIRGLHLHRVKTSAPEVRDAQTAAISPACRVRLAETESDVRAAQALRFAVFNLELNGGLESSFLTLLDADRFDAICDHLLVEDMTTSEVVGTYRLQTGIKASQGLG